MDDIRKLDNKYLNACFPNRRVDEIMGIDLVLIDSDTSGLMNKYIHLVSNSLVIK